MTKSEDNAIIKTADSHSSGNMKQGISSIMLATSVMMQMMTLVFFNIYHCVVDHGVGKTAGFAFWCIYAFGSLGLIFGGISIVLQRNHKENFPNEECKPEENK